ncbi:N-acyl homoserine lactonase family protein [Mesorhizobium sp. SP-1A]|jgi:glyoxylase-like metal-dependent hydrolase (beta-lactamase superfamily II)|uniref:N-acyl homoserine lactonase family protein n=1 Tax=Mesorhizobium sp. SP-1A TaxID=3077840 RepID=UPI0028F6CF8A|nr:N-acyl homoserine lactonase family protein [Mesorhizobium sp. SP-1A]
MTVRIHCILTGALESSYTTSVYGAPERHPLVKKEDLLPYGHKERVYNSDGTITPGLMVPVPIWLIEGEDKTILIDTGLGDCDEVMAMQGQYGIDYIATKSKDEEIVTALAQKGLKPEDIDVVALTHLHFDHIGNNELFTKARFVVQKDEVPFLVSPPPFATFYYREWQHKLTSISDRLDTIEGNYRLSKNVELVKVGGHAAGQMVVMVNTSLGKVCIGSDFYYNYTNIDRSWPMGPLWNVQQWIDNDRWVKSNCDIILPNHDFALFNRFPSRAIG